VDTVVDFLNDLDSKEGEFSSYEKSMILQDLKSVGTSTQDLETTLRNKCPVRLFQLGSSRFSWLTLFQPEYQATADELIQKTNGAFSTAIQTYSS